MKVRTSKSLIRAALLVLCLTCLAQDAFAESYTYDAQGRLATVTYDDGSTLTYNYDAMGNPTGIVVNAVVASGGGGGGGGGCTLSPNAGPFDIVLPALAIGIYLVTRRRRARRAIASTP